MPTEQGFGNTIVVASALVLMYSREYREWRLLGFYKCSYYLATVLSQEIKNPE